MLLPRLLTYGILVLLGCMVLIDTNIGFPLTHDGRMALRASIRHLESRHFADDARLADSMLRSGFKQSRFFTGLSRIADAHGSDLSYYAYTPVLSRSRIFLGDAFWEVDTVGRASILLHELTHVRRHRAHLWSGFPRSLDEAEAYRRQYDTHRAVRLSPNGQEGIVYWDMMIGVGTYVVPRYPEYAKRPDVREAFTMLASETARRETDYGFVLVNVVVAFVALMAGDRIGLWMACALLRRCSVSPLFHLGPWLVPIAVLTPILVLVAYVMASAGDGSGFLVQIMAQYTGMVLLGVFFFVGMAGGVASQVAKTH